MIDLQDGDILFDEEPHSYTVKGIKVLSVTQTIALAGLGPDFFLVPPAVLKMAQDRGSAVHLACAFMDAGELDWSTVDPRIIGYVKAYEKFRKECPMKTVAIEKKLSAMIGPYQLAGTPDLIGFIKGRRAVVDLKTSQTMSKSMGLQTAAYRLLWCYSNPRQLLHDRYGLQLKKDGTYKLIPHEDPDDEQAFLAALEYANAKKKIERWKEKYA